MIHKRIFGKRGFVAVLMCADARTDKDLMKRVDAAAQQFGVTHEYQLTYFMSKRLRDRRDLYDDLVAQAFEIIHLGYKVLITVGPEAEAAVNFMGRVIAESCMIIGVNTGDALDANAPYQFEMRNPAKYFSSNWSSLIKTCLQKNISQEEGMAQMKMAEEQRLVRDGGLFDDKYVLLMNRNRTKVMVRFDDDLSDDSLTSASNDLPLKERDRTIVFRA